MEDKITPTNNTVEVDCKHFELCFHCGKHMAVSVNSQAGFMVKCLNCGAEELETNDSRNIEKIKDIFKFRTSDISDEDIIKKIKGII